MRDDAIYLLDRRANLFEILEKKKKHEKKNKKTGRQQFFIEYPKLLAVARAPAIDKVSGRGGITRKNDTILRLVK